jgi:hypothetical protein
MPAQQNLDCAVPVYILYPQLITNQTEDAMSTIRVAIDEYKSPEAGKDFACVALTGDTYNHRDLIARRGFHFSDAIGHGKAWRSKTWLVANGPAKDPQFVALVSELRAAGVSVVRG